MSQAPLLDVALTGIGLLGPGLADWARGAAALREPASWTPAPTVLPAPAHLPPAERRRAGAVIKLSLAVAEQACAQAGADPAALATVFSSASGDGANCHALCEALASAERSVSPTRFTNSVHNAPAGYWHIAAASRAPSTSLAAFDASFAAGLLEAAAQSVALRRPVLMVCADVPYPQPLHALRPLGEAFGVALLLDAAPAAPALARLRLAPGQGPATRCDAAGFEALRLGSPAARALPLLQALARAQTAHVTLADGDEFALHVEVLA